jgi:putative transcriptional regulator
MSNFNVASVRADMKLSQPQFAKRFGLPVGTLRDWEQGRRTARGGSRVLLQMLEADPEGVQKILAKVD